MEKTRHHECTGSGPQTVPALTVTVSERCDIPYAVE